MNRALENAVDWAGDHVLLIAVLIVSAAAFGVCLFCRRMAKSAVAESDEHATNSVG